MSEFSFIEGVMDGQGGPNNGHGQGHAQVQQPTGNEGQHASNTAAYNAGIKLSDVFQGFKITPNGIVALFFIGYAVWLFVLYFIRHNEPLANQVIGTPNAGAPTSHADRIIVGGAKNALPIRTNLYNGHKEQAPESLPQIGDASQFSQQSQMAFGSAKAAVPPTPTPSAAYGHQPLAPGSHARVVQYGRERIVVGHPEPLPGDMHNTAVQQQAQQSAFGQPVNATYQSASAVPYTATPMQMAPAQASAAYAPTAGFAHHQLPNTMGGGTGANYLPVQTHEGLRLRTVVNR